MKRIIFGGIKYKKPRVLPVLLAGMLAVQLWGSSLQVRAEETDGTLSQNAETSQAEGEGDTGTEDDGGADSQESEELDYVPGSPMTEGEGDTGTEDDGGADSQENEELDYILGRPMTEEEKQAQRELYEYYAGLGGFVAPEEKPENGDFSASLYGIQRSLPAQYDARNDGIVPAIRNQNPYGNCWAFSSIACLEINLLKNGLADTGIDLSERHLTFFSSFSAPDPLGNDGKGGKSYYDASKNGGETYYNAGGNAVMAGKALRNWKGAVNEDVISEEMMVQGLNADDMSLAYGSDTYWMSNWYEFHATDMVAMKLAVLEYGAVSISYWAGNGNYYNPETGAQYCDKKITTNHAVTVIGWDDTYSRDNFTIKPENDGAWLVRNSWGDWFADGGYFWLSYEDKTLYMTAWAFEGMRSGVYDNNYQYDHATNGRIMFANSVANVFTAKAGNGENKEILKAVGIDLDDAGVEYSLQIYKNLTNLAKPDSGTPIFTLPQTGVTGYAGYYMIPLETEVLLNKGETFAVVFEFDKQIGVATEWSSDNIWHSEATASEGESFVGYSWGWDDFGARYNANLVIKAYTVNGGAGTGDSEGIDCEKITIEASTHEIFVGDQLKCSVRFTPANTTNKEVTWSSSNASVATVSSNGTITGKKGGTAKITAISKSGNRNAEWEITVIQPVTKVSFRYDTDSYCVGRSYEAIVTVEPADATVKSLSWSSSDTKVAEVDQKGKITVKAEGIAVIKVTAPNGVSASVTIRAEDMVRSFVRRMYTEALGRNAETQGLNDWSQRLMSHEIDGAGIADGFIMSDEFKNRNLSNEAFVDVLYRTFFNRAADAGGRSNWLEALASGKTRGYVLSGFVNSVEFDNLCDNYGIARGTMSEEGTPYNPGIRSFVERCYTKVMGREGEKAGIEDWTNRIITGQMSAEDVAKSFFFSDEYKNKRTSNEVFVETLYQTFMGRDSDPAGKSDWVGRLNNGTSRQEVLEGFSRSEEFAGILKSFGL